MSEPREDDDRKSGREPDSMPATPAPSASRDDASTADVAVVPSGNELLPEPIEIQFEPSPRPLSPIRGATSAEGELLEELAEDSLEVLRRLKAIEASQQSLTERLAQFEERAEEIRRATANHLETMRRELLGEHKSMASRAAFTAVVATLESLRVMRLGLHPKRDHRLIGQVTGIELALVTTAQSLGFEEFRPAVGEPFDPVVMQCMAQEQGPPGLVLRIVHPGYRGAGVVVRPAGVITGAPS